MLVFILGGVVYLIIGAIVAYLWLGLTELGTDSEFLPLLTPLVFVAWPLVPVGFVIWLFVMWIVALAKAFSDEVL